MFAIFGALAGFATGYGGASTFLVRHLVREAPADRVDPANEGAPIVVRAEFRERRLVDPEYGVEVRGAFVHRLEATFSTFSEGSGKSRTTVRRWGNPTIVPITGDAGITFGAYRVSTALLRDIGTTDDVPTTEFAIARSRRKQTCKLLDGMCYTGDPASPKIGDRRVSFRVRAAGPVAIFASQTNSELAPWLKGPGPRLLVGRIDEPLSSILDRIAKAGAGIGFALLSFALFAGALGLLRVLDGFPEALARRFQGVRVLNHFFVPLGLTITMDGIAWTRVFPRLGVPILMVGFLFAVLPLLIARPRQ